MQKQEQLKGGSIYRGGGTVLCNRARSHLFFIYMFGQGAAFSILTNLQKQKSLRFRMFSRVTALFTCAVGLEVYLGHSAVSGP